MEGEWAQMISGSAWAWVTLGRPPIPQLDNVHSFPFQYYSACVLRMLDFTSYCIMVTNSISFPFDTQSIWKTSLMRTFLKQLLACLSASYLLIIMSIYKPVFLILELNFVRGGQMAMVSRLVRCGWVLMSSSSLETQVASRTLSIT